jgi:hypothetical protein
LYVIVVGRRRRLLRKGEQRFRRGGEMSSGSKVALRFWLGCFGAGDLGIFLVIGLPELVDATRGADQNQFVVLVTTLLGVSGFLMLRARWALRKGSESSEG